MVKNAHFGAGNPGFSTQILHFGAPFWGQKHRFSSAAKYPILGAEMLHF